MFRQFVLLCRRLDLYGRELLAVDGTRIEAINNKDRNFTRSSLISAKMQLGEGDIDIGLRIVGTDAQRLKCVALSFLGMTVEYFRETNQRVRGSQIRIQC